MTDLSRAIWRKAEASYANGGCVEVAANLGNVIAVRDSTRPDDGAHVVNRPAFAALLADLKSGRYDITLRLSPGRRGTSLAGVPCPAVGDG